MMGSHSSAGEQTGLFAGGQSFQELGMPDADVRYFPSFYAHDEALALFDKLMEEASWKQWRVKMYEKEVDMPRLTAWHGDPGVSYSYSNVREEARGWTPQLLAMKERVEQASGERFNCVLLNLYRNGMDHVGWHADDERELGQAPAIGSISLGVARPFQMKHRSRKDEKREILLENGSYLLMRGVMQRHWLHQLPRRLRITAPRLNLTFRYIHPGVPRAVRAPRV